MRHLNIWLLFKTVVCLNRSAHKTSSSDRKAPERKPPPRQGHHPTVHEDALRRDVWFRAAVIAVPIAGLVILVLLILLAVRLLRAEYVTKSSTNHSVPRIFKSPQRSTDYKHVAVSIADDRGDVRTVLAPSCESECVKVASSRECTRTKVWTDKEFNFTLETSKMHETFSPSSDCCKSNCECCCLTRDIALTKSSNDVIVWPQSCGLHWLVVAQCGQGLVWGSLMGHGGLKQA